MTSQFLALPPGDGLVLGAGQLLAHLAGHAPAHRGRSLGGGTVRGRRLELEGDVGEGQHQGGDQEGLHAEDTNASSSAGEGRLICIWFLETVLKFHYHH